MEIYLAGGFTANLSKLWVDIEEKRREGLPYKDAIKAMEVYLAGGWKSNNNHRYFKTIADEKAKGKSFEEGLKKVDMEIYLAGEHPVKNGSLCELWTDLNILETFYYLRGNKHFPRLAKDMGNFLLDSGAFTFMASNSAVKADFDAYVEEYAQFIKQWDIHNFFELDIDSLVGLKEVERLRYKLEKLTGRKPIPVWHKNRGKEYFIKMCESYPYVAVGGIVTKEIPTNLYEKMFPWFIKIAHEHGCKIHGLGYTNIKGLHKFHFDSVDSTAWLYGNLSGSVYKFNPKNGMMDTVKAPEGKMLVSRAVALNNFNEWVRFMKYARVRL